jgi:hypothetical protein
VFDDVATAFAFHADEKAVVLLPLSFVRLKRSFHFLGKLYVNKPVLFCQAKTAGFCLS